MMPPEARPKISRNPEVVIGRILDAAEAEFMRAGFEAASTNRITDAFGGSKATLFRYFSSKEKLLAAVIERISAEWAQHVRSPDEESDLPREWLIGFSEQTLRWILSAPVLFIGRLGIAEGANLPDLRHVFSHFAADPLHEIVADRFAGWMQQGKLAPACALTLAGHFMDLVISGPVSRALYGVDLLEGSQLTAHAVSAVELFLGGAQIRR